MELTDEAKAEIKAAIEILKSDGIHFTKAVEKHLKGKEEPPADPKTDPKTEPPATEGQPPPVREGDPTPPAETPKRRGVWWGDRE